MINRFQVCCAFFVVGPCLAASSAIAQTTAVTGAVRDETGGALPGVSVELRGAAGSPLVTVSDAKGTFSFDRVATGHYEASFLLINFANTRRDVDVPSSGTVRVDAVLHLSLSADVTVTGKRTFTNLADVANPAENLVGVALSASQGAITARQFDARPIMRSGEVLETVPGVVISVSWSNARFTGSAPVGDHVPGSVATVISGGATLDSLHNVSGSIRLRYFGPRALIEDDSIRSKATSLKNLEGGYTINRRLKIAVDVFNLLDANDSDIDYYYTSRLFNEPADGVTDIHLHPALPRTARVNLIVGF